MDIEKLKKAYDEIYGKFEKELQKHYYYDYAIVDEMSSGVAGTLKHKIDETYLPFIEYVVKTNRQYYGGYSARELLTFIQTNNMFCLSNGIEAPLSLISIYYVDGNLSSAEYYFARDKYEANNDCECTVGYKIGIGFDGTKWFTLKSNLDPYKTTKSIWKEKMFANFHSDIPMEEFVVEKGVLKRYNGKQTSIVIPETVKSIGNEAFKGCKKIKSVTMGKSVTSIGKQAFYECVSLTEVLHPETIKRIGVGAFKYCSSLKNVFIPELVDYIPDDVFAGCDSLECIDLSEDNNVYKSVDGNLYFKDESTLVKYAVGKKDSSFEVPDSVKTVGCHVFSGAKNLKSIYIPSSVQRFGEYAFKGCESLTIYCESESKPGTWHCNWNCIGNHVDYVDGGYCPAVFGHKKMFYREKIRNEDITVPGGSSSIEGKIIVVTGDLENFPEYGKYPERIKFRALVEKHGGTFGSSITKKTDFLVCNDIKSATTKVKQAQAYNIPIISEQDFLDMLGEKR